MVIDNLTLHNFGVYEGRHKVELSPPNQDQPVLLFGGLNGRGKTTFMDAIQLALYGKLAQTSNRGSLAYNNYLNKCIHSAVPRDEGASVGISFRYASDGVEHEYNVRRLWKGAASSIREQIQVMKDGVRDRLLEENWAEFVETLLPNRVAQLFFFDGERVEALANPDTASAVLSTAIRALLGLDLVDRLTADLQVLERRKKVSGARSADRESVRQLEVELDDTNRRLDAAKQDRAGVQAELDRTAAKLRECKNRLRHEGAEIAERREALDAEATQSRDEMHRLHRELEAVAYGALPLALVQPLLQTIQRQSEVETRAETDRMVASALQDRNAALLAWLGQRPRSRKLVAEVRAFLDEELVEHGAAKVDAYLDLPGATRSQLADILANRLSNEVRNRNELLEAVDSISARLDDLDRTLAALPAPESLAPLLEERAALESRLATLETQYGALEQSVQQLVRLEEQQKRRLSTKLETIALRELEREDSERMLKFSNRARSSLRAFRHRVLEARISVLETEVLDSFRHLLAKENLVDCIRIDPETFSLTVHSVDGETLPTDRLSAGERQLLAVSILWGLAKASGRRLPVVIDTPMGRLDSNHRENLLDRYFPRASHQVVLLSTDEEIDEASYRRLGPSIGRAYRLEYSDAAKSTTVQPGYFWEH